jgi:hypothetical protein
LFEESEKDPKSKMYIYYQLVVVVNKIIYLYIQQLNIERKEKKSSSKVGMIKLFLNKI